MIIAIILILTAVALFLILRDDHDDSYTRREKSPARKAPSKPAYMKSETSKPAQPQQAPRPQAAAPQAGPSPVFERRTDMPNFNFLDRIEYDADLPELTMSSFISYLQEYCTTQDLGNIAGYVEVDPKTEALEVHGGNDRLLGYLPLKDRAAFFAFNPGKVVCPFAGHMDLSVTGKLYADIRIVLPASRDFVEESLTGFLGL